MMFDGDAMFLSVIFSLTISSRDNKKSGERTSV